MKRTRGGTVMHRLLVLVSVVSVVAVALIGLAALGARPAVAQEATPITEVVFDRNGFLYHGRVKALAEGAREAGLQF